MVKLFRFIKNLILPNYLHIIYRHEYFTPLIAGNKNYSFDAMKFKKIRNELIKQKLILRRNVIKPPKISENELQLVHHSKYIQKLKNPIEVGKILGLDYLNEWDDYILEYFKYITGGTVLGLELAITLGKPIINFGGGFHHAHSDKGEGFCLFNDVAVAIEKMRNKFKNINKFLIIDLDYHQGNGNKLFFKNDSNVFTFSIHEENWTNEYAVDNLDIELPSNINDDEYLLTLKEHLIPVLEKFSPDVVIYLSGSDIYEKDTLGAFNISETGVLKRDIIVYSEIHNRKLPVLILPAGGYGPHSWKLYFNFIKWIILNRKLRTKYFPIPAEDIL